MIEIFIYEDNPLQKKLLTDMIERQIIISSLHMEIAISTSDPQKIIDYIDNNHVNGLFFLGTNLQTEMSGVHLAEQIRKTGDRSAIVFITDHPKFMQLTFDYGIEAMGHITQGDQKVAKRKIAKYMELAYERLYENGAKRTRLQFQKGKDFIKETVENIMFFEIDEKRKRKIVLITKEQKIHLTGTLDTIEKMSSHFFRSHRSCVVNLSNVSRIIKDEIHMVNGSVCYVSSRKISQLKKKLRILNRGIDV